MSRAPELGDECRPGGGCPTCNPEPIYCQRCLERPVENKDDLCETCEAEIAADLTGDVSEPIPEGSLDEDQS